MHPFSNRSQMTTKCSKNKQGAHKVISKCITDVLTTFDVLCNLLLNRRMATWNLFVLYKKQTSTGSLFQNLSSLLESWPLPTLVNMKNAIWHYLLSIQNEAISLLAIHSYCQTRQFNGLPKVARKAFNIRELWNPVCFHGNKTVEFKLWSTSSRIVLQRIKHFWYKLAEISLSYLMKIWLSVWHHQLANLHILKTWISLEWKEIFENSKQLFSSYAEYFLCFKMA